MGDQYKTDQHEETQPAKVMKDRDKQFEHPRIAENCTTVTRAYIYPVSGTSTQVSKHP